MSAFNEEDYLNIIRDTSEDTLNKGREAASDALDSTKEQNQLVPTYSKDEMVGHFANGTDYSQDQLDAMSDDQWNLYNHTADEYFAANPTRKMRKSRLESRLALADELKKKADFIVEQTADDPDSENDYKEAKYASDFLVNHTSAFTDMDDKTAGLWQNKIEAMYKSANESRGHIQVAADAVSKGYLTIGNMLYQGFMMLKPEGLTQDDAENISGSMQVKKDLEISNPQKIGGVENINSIGDAIDWFSDVFGENLPRGLVATGMATVGAVATPAALAALGVGVSAGTAATVGSIVTGTLGTMAMNTGEAVQDQMDENRNDGDIRNSRGWALAQGFGYSILDGAFGVSAWGAKMWSGMLRKIGVKEVAKAAGVEELKDTAKKASLKEIGKDIFWNGMVFEGGQEVGQSGGIGRGIRYLQTGSIFRKKEDGTYETPGDAFLDAVNEFAGGAAAGISFGLLGGASSHINAKRTVNAYNKIEDALNDDKSYQQLDPYGKLLVKRHLVNDSFLATTEIIRPKVLASLRQSNIEIDNEIARMSNKDNKNAAERLVGQSARMYLDIFKSQYDLEDLDTASTMAENAGFKSSLDNRSEIEAMKDSLEEIQDEKTGARYNLFTSPSTGISVAQLLDADGNPTGRYIFNNNHEYKSPVLSRNHVDEDGNRTNQLECKSLEEAVMRARQLDLYNQWREKRMADKKAAVENVFNNLYGGRDINLVFVDRPSARTESVGVSVAGYNHVTNTVEVSLDKIDNLGKLYTVLIHERSHKDIVDFLRQLPTWKEKYGNAETIDWDKFDADRENLLAGVKGAKEKYEKYRKVNPKTGKNEATTEWGRSQGYAGEELLAERNSVYDLAQQFMKAERGVFGSVEDKVRSAIGMKMAVDLGLDPRYLMSDIEENVRSEMMKLFEIGYIKDESEVKRGESEHRVEDEEGLIKTSDEFKAGLGTRVTSEPTVDENDTIDISGTVNKGKTSSKSSESTGDGSGLANGASVKRADGELFTKTGEGSWVNVKTGEATDGATATKGGFTEIKAKKTSEKKTDSVGKVEKTESDAEKNRHDTSKSEEKKVESAKTASSTEKPSDESAKTETKNEPSESPKAEKTVSDAPEGVDAKTSNDQTWDDAKHYPVGTRVIGNDGNPYVRVESKTIYLILPGRPKSHGDSWKNVASSEIISQGQLDRIGVKSVSELGDEETEDKKDTDKSPNVENAVSVAPEANVEKKAESAPKKAEKKEHKTASSEKPSASKKVEMEKSPVTANPDKDTVTVEQGKADGELRRIPAKEKAEQLKAIGMSNVKPEVEDRYVRLGELPVGSKVSVKSKRYTKNADGKWETKDGKVRPQLLLANDGKFSVVEVKSAPKAAEPVSVTPSDEVKIDEIASKEAAASLIEKIKAEKNRRDAAILAGGSVSDSASKAASDARNEELKRNRENAKLAIDYGAPYVNDAQRKSIDDLIEKYGAFKNVFQTVKINGAIVVEFDKDRAIISEKGEELSVEEINRLMAAKDTRAKTVLTHFKTIVSGYGDAPAREYVEECHKRVDRTKYSSLSDAALLKKAADGLSFGEYAAELWYRWAVNPPRRLNGGFRQWFLDQGVPAKNIDKCMDLAWNAFVTRVVKNPQVKTELEKDINDFLRLLIPKEGSSVLLAKQDVDEKMKDLAERGIRSYLESIGQLKIVNYKDDYIYKDGRKFPAISNLPVDYGLDAFLERRIIAFDHAGFPIFGKDGKPIFKVIPPKIAKIDGKLRISEPARLENREESASSDLLLYTIANEVLPFSKSELEAIAERKRRAAEIAAKWKAERDRMQTISDASGSLDEKGYVSTYGNGKRFIGLSDHDLAAMCVPHGDLDASPEAQNEVISRLAEPERDKDGNVKSHPIIEYIQNQLSRNKVPTSYDGFVFDGVVDELRRQWNEALDEQHAKNSKTPVTNREFWSNLPSGYELDKIFKGIVNVRVKALANIALPESVEERNARGERRLENAENAEANDEVEPLFDAFDADERESTVSLGDLEGRTRYDRVVRAVNHILNSLFLTLEDRKILTTLRDTFESKVNVAALELQKGLGTRSDKTLRRNLEEAYSLEFDDWSVCAEAAKRAEMRTASYRAKLKLLVGNIERGFVSEKTYLKIKKGNGLSDEERRKAGLELSSAERRKLYKMRNVEFDADDIDSAIQEASKIGSLTILDYKIGPILQQMHVNGDDAMAWVVDKANNGETDDQIIRRVKNGELDGLAGRNVSKFAIRTVNDLLEDAYDQYGWIDSRVYGDKSKKYEMLKGIVTKLFDEFVEVTKIDLPDAENPQPRHPLLVLTTSWLRENKVDWGTDSRLIMAFKYAISNTYTAVAERNVKYRALVDADYEKVQKMMERLDFNELLVASELKDEISDDRRVKSMIGHWRMKYGPIARAEERVLAKKNAETVEKGLTGQQKNEAMETFHSYAKSIPHAKRALVAAGWSEEMADKAEDYLRHFQNRKEEDETNALRALPVQTKIAMLEDLASRRGDEYVSDKTIRDESKRIGLDEAMANMVINKIRPTPRWTTVDELAERAREAGLVQNEISDAEIAQDELRNAEEALAKAKGDLSGISDQEKKRYDRLLKQIKDYGGNENSAEDIDAAIERMSSVGLNGEAYGESFYKRKALTKAVSDREAEIEKANEKLAKAKAEESKRNTHYKTMADLASSNGNVIPLSERFNQEKSDIRFKTILNDGLPKHDEMAYTRAEMKENGVIPEDLKGGPTVSDVDVDKAAESLRARGEIDYIANRGVSGAALSDAEVRALQLEHGNRVHDALYRHLNDDELEINEKAMDKLVKAIVEGGSAIGKALRQFQRGFNFRTRDTAVYMKRRVRAALEKQAEDEFGPGGAEKHAKEIDERMIHFCRIISEYASNARVLHDTIDKLTEENQNLRKEAKERDIKRVESEARREGYEEGFNRANAEWKKRRSESVNDLVANLGVDEKQASVAFDLWGEFADSHGLDTAHAGNPEVVLTDKDRAIFSAYVKTFGSLEKAREVISRQAKGYLESVVGPLFDRFAEEEIAKADAEVAKEEAGEASPVSAEKRAERRVRAVRKSVEKQAKKVNVRVNDASGVDTDEVFSGNPGTSRVNISPDIEKNSPKAASYIRRLEDMLSSAALDATNVADDATAMARMGECIRTGFKLLTIAEPDMTLDAKFAKLAKYMNGLRDSRVFTSEDAKMAVLGEGEFAPLRPNKVTAESIRKAKDLLGKGRVLDAARAVGIEDAVKDADILAELERRISRSLDKLLNQWESSVNEDGNEEMVGKINELIAAMNDIHSGSKTPGTLLDDYLGLAYGMKDYRRKKSLVERIKSRIDVYERKIATKDFEPTPKREKIDDAKQIVQIQALMRRLERMREQFKHEQERFRLKKMPWLSRQVVSLFELLGEAKAVVGSMDFSSVLRQGGQMTWAHPFLAVKNLKRMAGIFLNEDKAQTALNEIWARPNAKYYAEAGIQFTDWGPGSLSGEDAFLLNRYRMFTNQKFIKAGIQSSERSFAMFLNMMRADLFDAMVASSPKRTASAFTTNELKVIGNYINIASQRGSIDQQGKLGQSIKALNAVLWSPRNLISRFQFIIETGKLLLPGVNPYGANSAMMRKMVAFETARYLGGVVLTVLFTKMMADLFRGDDEPPEDIVIDPTSSDFLKVKMGNTRLDFLSGLQQIMVFSMRLITHRNTNLRGETKEIKNPSDYYALIGRFARSKMSPAASFVWDTTLMRETFDRQDISYDWRDQLTNDKEKVGAIRYFGESLFCPLLFTDVVDQAKYSGIGRAPITWALTALGAGVQAFDPYTYKQMSDDFKYFKRIYAEAETYEERKKIEERHPMLKRAGSIEEKIREINKIKRDIKNLEKSGANVSAMYDMLEREQKRAINLMSGFDRPMDTE